MTRDPIARSGKAGIALVRASAYVAVAVLALIIGYILVRGAPVITPEFIFGFPEKMGREGGIFPSIVGTVVLTVISVLIAAPLGIGTAIFLTEYTREGTFSRIVRYGTESLAGIPSIIFGLFGFLFFVIQMGMGWSILSGSLTLAAMMLPTIVRTAEEAIRSVPDSYREISFALGASRWQTVTSVVLRLRCRVSRQVSSWPWAGQSAKRPRLSSLPGRRLGCLRRCSILSAPYRFTFTYWRGRASRSTKLTGQPRYSSLPCS